MKTIKNITEIRSLKTTFPGAFVEYLEKYYLELMVTLKSYDDSPEEEFFMESYNEFIILEEGDSILSIPDIGVYESDGEIFGSFEFVNKINIDNSPNGSIQAYMGGILADNEFMILIFILKETLSPREEAFLGEYVIAENTGGEV